MLKFRKYFGLLVVFTLVISCISPISTFAATSNTTVTSERDTLKAVKVGKEDIKNTKKLVEAIEELDSKLNMYDLSQNTQEEIDSLSKEAKEFYSLYLNKISESNGNFTEEDAFEFMNSALPTTTSEKESLTESSNSITAAYSVISVKKYYLSNQNVKDFAAAAGVNGSFWGLMTAIAKAFSKSPTYITALIVAIPALGAAALSACNRYGRGVVITDYQVGATHSWSCSAR